MTVRERGRPYNWETPWLHRPCRQCHARAVARSEATRRLTAYLDCPSCLGTGIEGPDSPDGLHHLPEMTP